MNKRIKKKKAYKQYIRDIFEGYEKMIENKDIQELRFTYRSEETVLARDAEKQIRFLTHDI